jgi:hypothetical protein
MLLGGVEHHFDAAVDMPIGRLERPDIEPEATRKG